VDVRDAISTRRSVRAFLPTPVAPDVLERVFATAQRAPSWCNIQPWRAVVTAPSITDRLREALQRAATSEPPTPEAAWPLEYPEPYGTHRRDCGVALYRAMGIARDDLDARRAAWLRNYVCFDAPHVAIVSMDRRFGLYMALDVGCWLQTVLLAATAEGVATCAQAALAAYPEALRSVLSIPEGEQILFGISLGYEDVAAPANACRTTRSPVAQNVRFLGF
jgi:nitroreductase